MRDLYSPEWVEISEDVFRRLSFATPGGLVCPRLQHLTWTFAWGSMQQFLSPYLVSVAIFGDGMESGDPALTTTISLLPTMYLEDFSLHEMSPPYTSIHSALSEVVQRLNPCFKRLTTESSLPEPTWKHLASLPKLESLRFSDTPRTEISKFIPHENAFPALERMEIKVDNAHQHWSFLFSLLKSSPLRSVRVTTSRRIRGVDVPGQVTTAILGAELQRSIDILIFTESDPANFTFLSHLAPFGSLKTLTCITKCRWGGQCVSPLTDPDIERLARGLPQLVSLRLGHMCKRSLHRTTIKSMISLSTHCTSLQYLSLPCNLTNIFEDVKTESGEPDSRLEIRSPCKLRSLAFRWLVMPPAEDIEALGIACSALSHLFPRLGSVPG